MEQIGKTVGSRLFGNAEDSDRSAHGFKCNGLFGDEKLYAIEYRRERMTGVLKTVKDAFPKMEFYWGLMPSMTSTASLCAVSITFWL